MGVIGANFVLSEFLKSRNHPDCQAVCAAGDFAEESFPDDSVYLSDDALGLSFCMVPSSGWRITSIFWHVLRDGEFDNQMDLPFGLIASDSPQDVIGKLGRPTARIQAEMGEHLWHPEGLRYTEDDLTTAIDFERNRISLVTRCVSVDAERVPQLQ